jgi:hypothetical protein
MDQVSITPCIEIMERNLVRKLNDGPLFSEVGDPLYEEMSDMVGDIAAEIHHGFWEELHVGCSHVGSVLKSFAMDIMDNMSNVVAGPNSIKCPHCKCVRRKVPIDNFWEQPVVHLATLHAQESEDLWKQE